MPASRRTERAQCRCAAARTVPGAPFCKEALPPLTTGPPGVTDGFSLAKVSTAASGRGIPLYHHRRPPEGAFDLEGLDSVLVLYDTINLENSVNRGRLLVAVAQAGGRATRDRGAREAPGRHRGG